MGRPRQDEYNIPESELDAYYRTHALSDLILKVDKVSEILHVNQKSPPKSGLWADITACDGFVHFGKITDCTYKTYANKKEEKSEDSIQPTYLPPK